MLKRLLVVFLLWGVPLQAHGAETVMLRPFQPETVHTGFTRAVEERTLSSEVSGVCTAVHVDVGDVIGEEGILVEIDPTFVKLALEDNRIAIAKAERQLELERKTVNRLEKLIERQSTAQAVYDEALLQAEVLEITLNELANERTRLKERLRRHTLRGTSGWTVVNRLVDPDEHVREGEPVITLGDYRKLQVSFLLTYEELELLRQQEQLYVFLPELNQRVSARIFRVAPDFSSQTRKINADLLIDDVVTNSRGGLRGRLKLEGQAREDVFRVPVSAVISRYDAHWLQRPDGSRVQVILLGRTSDGSDAVVQQEMLSSGVSVLLRPTTAE